MQGQVQGVVNQLFPEYDRDGSGELDARELGSFLSSALRRLGINATVTDQQADTALKVIDKDKDKKVNKAEAVEALKSILAYKQQKGGSGTQQPTVNPSGNNSWSQPPQNNNWGQQPPSQPNNNWGQPPPAQNNSWGQPPPQPNYGNSWAPGQNYGGNNWQQPPQQNNWNPPPTNNSWGPTNPQSGGWGQQQPNYGNSWSQPQPNNWNNQHGNDGWAGTSFNSQEDIELKQLIDQLFTRYDSDRSGGLDKRELTRSMNELFNEYGVSMRINERQAGTLMRAIDQSGDGKVQKSEFFSMVKMVMGGGV